MLKFKKVPFLFKSNQNFGLKTYFKIYLYENQMLSNKIFT